jgi:hypothetical protein
MSSRALLALWSQGCHKHFQLVRFPLTLGLCVCLVVVIHGSVPLSPQFYTAAICWCFSWRPVPNRKPRVVWLHSRSSFRDCIVSTLYVGVTKVRVVSLPRYSKSFVTPLMVGEFICGASRQHADYGWPWPDKPILSFAYDNPTNTSKNVPVDYYYYYYYYYREMRTLIIIMVGFIYLAVNFLFLLGVENVVHMCRMCIHSLLDSTSNI